MVVDTPLEERRDLARARRGDAEAYARVVRAHQAVAFRAAWLITGSAAEAEEAAQDAFLKAHRSLGRFREDAPFRPWLLAIVANEARNRRVSAGRRERLALRARDQARVEVTAGSAETAILAAEERAGLLAAIERLPERDRLVISCRYLLELNEAETAAALGCRPGTVKSRLSRALDRLRAEVRDD